MYIAFHIDILGYTTHTLLQFQTLLVKETFIKSSDNRYLLY